MYVLMRECEKGKGVHGRGVREGMDVVGEGGSCEKDLRLIGKLFQRPGEELRKERSENLSLDVRVGRERQMWSEEPVLTVGLMLMRLRRYVGSDVLRRL